MEGGAFLFIYLFIVFHFSISLFPVSPFFETVSERMGKYVMQLVSQQSSLGPQQSQPPPPQKTQKFHRSR